MTTAEATARWDAINATRVPVPPPEPTPYTDAADRIRAAVRTLTADLKFVGVKDISEVTIGDLEILISMLPK